MVNHDQQRPWTNYIQPHFVRFLRLAVAAHTTIVFDVLNIRDAFKLKYNFSWCHQSLFTGFVSSPCTTL